MDELGLATVVGLLFIKEAGVPIPIPGDLLVLGTGIAAASGAVEPLSAVLVIVAATIAGGVVQFSILRGGLRRILIALLRRIGVADARVESVASRLRARGAAGVAIARMTPGLRIVTIPAAAVAAIAPSRFVAGLATGNSVFVGGHFALGAALGAPAIEIAGSLGPAVIAAVVGLAILGAVGWVVLARRHRATAGRPRLQPAGIDVDAAGDWTDAACPACLALALVGDRGASERTVTR